MKKKIIKKKEKEIILLQLVMKKIQEIIERKINKKEKLKLKELESKLNNI